ncbi:MAG: 50S ribosomal protein L9 [Leptotrichia sp.]|uniref:Large ribosomal subunit protein bL9 n=1 Tax=Leptotrichia rugosa TaxID=3239302 RepID=A0AB39VJL4_9FUSO|nr:50S ribosomal protein L9 [uncultured Leptotrichia sp.]RKW36261.1 MAG: 50S ribosomal protein L9 [Leptotrichia sp.]
MKIKVILTETIKGIGKKDEIIEVKDGYANNFLLNKNKAVLATPENINKLQKKNEKIEKNRARDVKEANELKNILAKKEVVLKVKAGENGKVFGSIGAKEIAEAIKEQLNIEIDKKKISSNTRVKDLGLHIVELKLHSEVKGSIKVKVEAK